MPAPPTRDGPRVNEEIRSPQVRLIDQDGEMIGVMSARDAVLRAYSVGLDLLEISPNAEPPDNTRESMLSTVDTGSSSAHSRVPGPPPRTSAAATAGLSNKTTVEPDASRSSEALPTRTPGTSVIKFRKSALQLPAEG